METLFATLLLATTVSSLAQLFVLSARATADARRTTMATIVAGQKMEQLKAEAASGAPGAGGSLASNVDGFCDFLDAQGQPIGGGTSAPAGTAYLRRWSVEGPVARPPGAFILQVVVHPAQHAAAAHVPTDGSSRDSRTRGGAHLVAVHSTWDER